MSELQPEPKISVEVTTIETREIRLTEDDVKEIILTWAKSHGFSHRASVEITCTQGAFLSEVLIGEKITTSKSRR